MTARPGYARARAMRERAVDRIWRALREADSPLSRAEIAEAAACSDRQARRTIGATVAAGMVEIHGEDRQQDGAIPLYRLAPGAPAVAPVLRLAGGGHLAAPVSTLTGADLRAWRGGRSVREAAQALGLSDLRTYRRYEARADAPIPDRIADAIGRARPASGATMTRASRGA